MRNESFVFRGDTTSEEKEKAVRALLVSQTESDYVMEGEYEKTNEELLFIGLINRYLEEKFKELGVEGFSPIEPRRIHLLNRSAFQFIRRGDERGHFNALRRSIFINKEDEKDRMHLFVAILHEVVHCCSHQKFEVYEQKKKNGLNVDVYRVGYSTNIHKDDTLGSEHGHFNNLNEGITDIIVLEIFSKYRDEMIDLLKITEEEENQPMRFYPYVELIEMIAKKIAEYRHKDYATVIKKFERGAFTGDMMHLRDVEQIYGPGSLRVLAATHSDVRVVYSAEMVDKVFRYFETDDEREREKIVTDILDKRELDEYLKLREKGLSGEEAISDQP
jgi:hypothetical protein